MGKDPLILDGKRRPSASRAKDPNAALRAVEAVRRGRGEPPRPAPPAPSEADATPSVQRALTKMQRQLLETQEAREAADAAREEAEQRARGAESRAKAAELRMKKAEAQARKAALAGAPPARGTRKRRPRGAVHEELHQILVRLPPTVLAYLEDTAEAYGLDKTAAIRVAITEWRASARAKGLIER